MNPRISNILKYSRIFILIMFFIKTYESSKSKVIVDRIILWSRESSIFILWTRYMRVESTVEYSIAYRLLSKMGNKLDNLAKKLNIIIIFLVKKSRTSRFVISLVKETVERTYGVVIMAILGFIAGYGLFVSMLNIWSFYRLFLLGITLAIALILYSIEDSWKDWLKESIFYRVYNYIFD